MKLTNAYIIFRIFKNFCCAHLLVDSAARMVKALCCHAMLCIDPDSFCSPHPPSCKVAYFPSQHCTHSCGVNKH